jgi:hypothetical protein
VADTGYNWEANWTVLDAAIVLTQGGTITDQSAEIDCDGKAAILISIDTDYSDHTKATAGLKISILRDVDDTVYESASGAAVSFEMPFTQNGTERKTIALDCSQFQKIVLVQDWGNTTASSVATTATAYKFATVPVAS